MKRTLVAVVVTMVAGCATVDTSTLPRMTLDFAFDQRHKCQGCSPQLRLGGVPAGVASYDVRMTDLDVPSFNHWSQTIRAAGPVIPEGAGVGYYGPCPPSGTHRYEIAVTARGAAASAARLREKTVAAGR